MIKNKKGSGAVTILLSILVIAVVGLGAFVVYNSVQQTALAKADASKTPAQVSLDTKTGDVAVLKAYDVDKEANSETQKSIQSYFWLQKADGTFDRWIGGVSGFSLSASSTTSVSPVSVGDSVYGIAFNSSMYGTIGNKVMTTESNEMKLESNKICNTPLELLLYNDQAQTGKNLSVGASMAESYDYMRFKVNATDCAYNLAGFMFDTVSIGSNVSTIAVESDAKYTSIAKSGKSIERAKDTDDFVFALSTPVMLHEGQKWFSGVVKVTADGDGCHGEAISIYAFDEAPFVDKDGVGIKTGWEDNQATPADVGGGDSRNANTEGTSFFCNA